MQIFSICAKDTRSLANTPPNTALKQTEDQVQLTSLFSEEGTGVVQQSLVQTTSENQQTHISHSLWKFSLEQWASTSMGSFFEFLPTWQNDSPFPPEGLFFCSLANLQNHLREV
jgi:hypothetical protein